MITNDSMQHLQPTGNTTFTHTPESIPINLNSYMKRKRNISITTPTPPSKRTSTNLRQISSHIPKAHRDLLGDLHIPTDNGCHIHHLINTNTLIAASDGSSKGKKGSFSFIIGNHKTNNCMYGGRTTTLKCSYITSRRVEALGAYATIILSLTH